MVSMLALLFGICKRQSGMLGGAGNSVNEPARMK